MNKDIKRAEEHLKYVKEILQGFKTKEEAVDYLAKETKLPREECDSAYDILIKIKVEE